MSTEATLPPVPNEKPRRGFFSRGAHNGTQNKTMAPAQANDHEALAAHNQRRGFMTGFTFSHWIRLNLVDLLCMAAMGAVGLGVYEAKPAPSRSFPVQQVDGTVAYPE